MTTALLSTVVVIIPKYAAMLLSWKSFWSGFLFNQTGVQTDKWKNRQTEVCSAQQLETVQR